MASEWTEDGWRCGCLYKPVVTWCWFCASVFSFPSRNVKRKYLFPLGSNQTTGSLIATQRCKTLHHLGFCLPGNSFGDFHGILGLPVEATHDCLSLARSAFPLWERPGESQVEVLDFCLLCSGSMDIWKTTLLLLSIPLWFLMVITASVTRASFLPGRVPHPLQTLSHWILPNPGGRYYLLSGALSRGHHGYRDVDYILQDWPGFILKPQSLSALLCCC